MTPPLTDQQRARERAIQFALVMDSGMVVAYTLAAILAGSVTMLAELVRGVLMYAIEVFALLVMRRIHRGRMAVLEFGSGKLEQLVNLLIAGGMLAGAAWIILDAATLVRGAEVHGSPSGFAFAAIAAAVNLYINVVAWDGMRRAARGGGSLIMQGQLQARVVKMVSSAFVQVTLTIATLSTDAGVIVWADAIGALFVCGFIIHSAVGMLRAGLPELIDRSVTEEFQAAINRMLAKHFDDYDRLDQVRTRRSGETVYAEVALAFTSTLTVGEVNARIDAMKASLREEVGDADISIVAAAC
ncbi:MAG TPA: cation transporter [Vicinamibacterales bacterium]